MTHHHFWKKNWLWFASAAAVILIFQFAYGLEIILPANISWLMTVMHDWGQHYLGWYFYRNESWTFPIGEINNCFYPVGTNVGFTDSIPLLAILFKPLSFLLPEDFQYFGIWLFSCHLLAAYFTIRLCSLFKLRSIFILIAVIFIAANPVLIYRGMHPALCAHWLLIASLYVYFLDPLKNEPKKILLYQFILLILAGLINPYLCFMILGFTIILSLRLFFYDKVVARNLVVAYNIVSIFSLVSAWYIIGMLGNKNSEELSVSGGYGLYSLNLNSLVDSFGFSSFFPQMKQVSLHQYEGYMYLGLGVILLLGFSIIYKLFFSKKIKDAPQPVSYRANLFPLIALFIIYILFSITHVVSLNDKILFKIPIPEFLIKIGGIFRASARFFWPVYYTLLIVGFIILAKSKINHFAKLALFSIALIIQLYDTKRLFTYRDLSYGPYRPPIDEKNWNTLIGEFDEIIMYPPFQGIYLENSDYQYFCYLAARARKPITTGYVARGNSKAERIYTDSLQAGFAKGTISPKAIYITTAANLSAFSPLIQSGAVQLNILDNYYYLFSSNIANPMLSTLSQKLNQMQKSRLDSSIAMYGKKNVFVKTNKIDIPEPLTIRYSVESLNDNDRFIIAKGWAFIDSTKNNKSDSIFFLLNNKTVTYIARTNINARPDVTNYFNRPYLNDAGFDALIFKDSLEKGIYELCIAIKNIKGEWAYQTTEKTISVGAGPVYSTVEVLTTLPPAVPTIRHSVEIIEAKDSIVKISGWAFFPNEDNDDCSINVVLTKDEKRYKIETRSIQRPDVTSYFKSKKRLDKSGFEIRLLTNSLPDGTYKIGIMIVDSKTNKAGIIFSDKSVDIK